MEVQICETMVKVHINKLPNECLTIIFKNLDLHKMIQLRIICVRWQGVIEAICKRKRSLRICQGGGWQLAIFNQEMDGFLKWKKSLPKEHLDLSGLNFDSGLCDFLVHLFPNIEHLAFPRVHIKYQTFRQLCDMFEQWPNLSSFFLYGSPEKVYDEIPDLDTIGDKYSHIDKYLLQIIRPMTSLRNLYLCMGKLEMALPAKILSKLDHIFVGGKCLAPFAASLSKLKPDCKVRIRILDDEKTTLSEKLSNMVAKGKDQFAPKVTHLVCSWLDESADLEYICRHFVNLQFLQFKICSIVRIYISNLIFHF